MNCAWRSVAKPGNGSVSTSAAWMPLPLRRTRMPLASVVTWAPAWGQHVERRLQMLGAGVAQQHVAAGHGGGHGEGAGFDAVGDDVDGGAMQRRHALDGEGARADAGNLRAHGDEAIGDVVDFGLHGGVLDHRGAAGQRCRHHDGVGGADRHFWEFHRGADEAALGRPGDDIALVDIDLGASSFRP